MTRVLLVTLLLSALLPVGCASTPRGQFVFTGYVVREATRAPLGGVPVVVTYTPPKFSLVIEEVQFQEIARTTTAADGSFSIRSPRRGNAVSLVALGTRKHTEKLGPGSFVAYGESVALRNPSHTKTNVISVHRWFSPASSRHARRRSQ